MKNSIAVVIILFFSYQAFATSMQTGIFEDREGFIDPTSNHEVVASRELNGAWFVSLKTQFFKADVLSIKAYTNTGDPIEMNPQPGLSQVVMNGKLWSGTTKLYLQTNKGTPFYLIYET